MLVPPVDAGPPEPEIDQTKVPVLVAPAPVVDALIGLSRARGATARLDRRCRDARGADPSRRRRELLVGRTDPLRPAAQAGHRSPGRQHPVVGARLVIERAQRLGGVRRHVDVDAGGRGRRRAAPAGAPRLDARRRQGVADGDRAPGVRGRGRYARGLARWQPAPASSTSPPPMRPGIVAEPPSLSFGAIQDGGTASLELVVRDLGGGAGDWAISVSTVGGAPAGVTVSAPPVVTVPAGGTATIAVQARRRPGRSREGGLGHRRARAGRARAARAVLAARRPPDPGDQEGPRADDVADVPRRHPRSRQQRDLLPLSDGRLAARPAEQVLRPRPALALPPTRRRGERRRLDRDRPRGRGLSDPADGARREPGGRRVGPAAQRRPAPVERQHRPRCRDSTSPLPATGGWPSSHRSARPAATGSSSGWEISLRRASACSGSP